MDSPVALSHHEPLTDADLRPVGLKLIANIKRGGIRLTQDDATIVLRLLGEWAQLQEIARALEQACRDLQQAHDEIVVLQGVTRDAARNHDWPQWTPQANTIRWAEKLLGKELGKRGAQP